MGKLSEMWKQTFSKGEEKYRNPELSSILQKVQKGNNGNAQNRSAGRQNIEVVPVQLSQKGVHTKMHTKSKKCAHKKRIKKVRIMCNFYAFLKRKMMLENVGVHPKKS